MDRIRAVPFGTSAGTPTATRNVSSLAVFLDGRALLFDCGEGAQHQIIRGPYRLSSLEAILISHLHGDHVYGLPGLLATLSMEGRERPLSIYGPPRLDEFLGCAIDVSRLRLGYQIDVHQVGPGLVRRGEGYTVFAALLDHRMPSFGYAVVEDDRPGHLDVNKTLAAGLVPGPLYRRLKEGESVTLPDGRILRSEDVVGKPRPGRRVVYCSDTRPCPAEIELARNADLLIHESTYGDDFAEQAREYGHSTARQAAEVALSAGVRRLALTHFSPRYNDTSVLVREARAVFPDVIAAEELVEIDVR